MSEQRLGPPGGGARWISPKFTSDDWEKLDLSNRSPDWNVAVEIFLDRINGRFLAPVEAIRKHIDPQITEFAGFVIMAIDCLLIETLVQFRSGEDETKGNHAEAFWDFFKQSDFFKYDFDSRRMAVVFYRHFRCGILHQAQTKKSSLVRYGRRRMVEASVAGDLEEGLIIDRELFHNALVNEINSYVQRLLLPKNKELRERFVRKMNLVTQ
jgi:hypothetical protein